MAGKLIDESEGYDFFVWQGGKDEARRRSGSYVDEPKTKANAARRKKRKPNGPVAQLARAHD